MGSLDKDANIFSSTSKGLVPASGGSGTEFLSADGTFKTAGGSEIFNWTNDHNSGGNDLIMTNNNNIFFRNNADDGNLSVLNLNASDELIIGNTSTGIIMKNELDTVFQIQFNGTDQRLEVNKGAFGFYSNVSSPNCFTVRDEVVSDNQPVGTFQMWGQDEDTNLTLYTEMQGIMVSDIAGAEEGSTKFKAREASAGMSVYFEINPSSSHNLKFFKPIEIDDAIDFIFDTSTGTKFGTGTDQKIGFWDTTPIVQPTALTVADAVTIDATFDSTEQTTMINMRTRINELETKLQAIGLIA